MKYLVSAFTGLGNAVLNTPFLAALKQNDTDAEIFLIGDNRTGALDILQSDPNVKEKYCIPVNASITDKWKALKWIRRQRFDVFFLPFASQPLWLRAIAPFCNVGRVLQHINLDKPTISAKIQKRFHSVNTTFVQVKTNCHEIDLYFDLLEEALGKEIRRYYKTTMHCIPDNKVKSKFGIYRRYIAIQPGAAGGAATAKRWPVEYFIRFIMLFKESFPDYDIVALGSKNEYEIYIKPLCERFPGIIVAAGKSNVKDLTGLINFADMVLCHDSGVMHIANALQVPLIALYGPTDYIRTAPKGSTSVIIRKDLWCSPCMQGFKISEKESALRCPKPLCMLEISPEEVLESVSHILCKLKLMVRQ